MLHAYGGSPEMVRSYTSLPHGVGRRVFFSFNRAIQINEAAVIERIRAVPDDRVLAESDQTRVAAVEAGLVQSCQLIAEAKGWGAEETIERVRANFYAFYEGFIDPPIEGATG